MDDTTTPNLPPETEEERRARLAWEAAAIAAAEAEVAAGLLIPQHEVDAWLDSLETDHPLPMPPARKRG